MKFRLLLFFLIFNSFAKAQDLKTVQFHHSKFQLPIEFEQLSTEEVNLFKQLLSNRKNLTVFNKVSSDDDLLLIIFYDSLLDISHFTFEKTMQLKRNVLLEEGIKINSWILDTVNQTVITSISRKNEHALIGYKIDQFGIQTFQLSSNTNEIKTKELELLSEILNSVTFKHPFIFQKRKELLEAKKQMESSGLMLTISGILAAIVWGIRRLIKKTQ